MTQPQPGWRALDIATGTGHTAFAFAPAVAWVTAVDLTSEMLKQAERVRKDRGYGNVELHLADAHDLPFPDGAFDLVTCRRAAHHFSNIDRALSEMHRVLRPGGRLMIDDRASPADPEVDSILHRLDVLHDASHVRQYSVREWTDLLERASFTLVSLEEYRSSRPLTAFTKDVGEAEVREIEAVIARLTDRQRAVFEFREEEGRAFLNHFYITLVADRR